MNPKTTKTSAPLVFFFLLLLSCIDPFYYDIPIAKDFPITIYGRITNERGPYQVHINRSFDVQSKSNLRTPVSARKVSISDERGYSEILSEVDLGIYQTDSSGMKGRVGGVYKLLVEFDDGRIYESIPDTLLESGKLDSIIAEFNSTVDFSGSHHYGFDVKVNGTGNQIGNTNYKWDLTGTFESITHPELIDPAKSACYPIPEENIPCNVYPPCTGIRWPSRKKVHPCTCCKCWYQFFNPAPIITIRGDLVSSNPVFHDVPIYRVPLNEWYFMFKVHLEITQSSISDNTYKYFQSIVKQREAVGSLFQPITGQIKSAFVQTAGKASPIYGIFYSAGISRKTRYIERSDVKPSVPIPEVDFTIPGIGWVSCLDLFPNATNVKPDFWIE